MRKFNKEPPAPLADLHRVGLLRAIESERLDYMSLHPEWRAERLRPLVESAEALSKQSSQRDGLCSDDWNWHWGSRLSVQGLSLEIRAYHSFSTIPVPDSPPFEQGDYLFETGYQAAVIECNGNLVLNVHMGADDLEGPRTVIRVARFVEGPWVGVVLRLIAGD